MGVGGQCHARLLYHQERNAMPRLLYHRERNAMPRLLYHWERNAMPWLLYHRERNAMSRLLYHWERPGRHCIGGWVGPRTGLENILPTPGFPMQWVPGHSRE